MKTIIPTGVKLPDELSNDFIPVDLVDSSKIIVIDQYRSALGIVTRVPTPGDRIKYGVIDLFSCNNFWPHPYGNLKDVINKFASDRIHVAILQFDDKKEFIQWLLSHHG